MNGTAKTLLLIGGALIAYNAFAKATAGGNLLFYPDKVHSLSLSGSGPVMVVHIRVQNTSNQNFTINGFAGNVFANETLIGNAENFNQAVIAPRSQAIYPITIRMSWLGMVSNVIDAFNGGPVKIKIEVDAKANVDRYQVPVKLFYNIGQ